MNKEISLKLWQFWLAVISLIFAVGLAWGVTQQKVSVLEAKQCQQESINVEIMKTLSTIDKNVCLIANKVNVPYYQTK